MNWNAVNFDWNQIRAFLATCEEGSLSAAARALGQTQPTLSRQLTALENELGVQLLERSKRGQQITPAGKALLEHVAAMRDAAMKVSLIAAGQSDQLEGEVVISVTDTVATQLMPKILKSLRQFAPGLSIKMLSSPNVHLLEKREADIAIRHLAPEHPDLIARKLLNTSAALFASQDYINQCGGAISRDNIADVEFIGMDGYEKLIHIIEQLNLGIRQEQFKLVTSNSASLVELVRIGVGVSFLMQPVAKCVPGLVNVIPEAKIDVPFWIVTHREMRTSRRIKVVFEHLVKAFKQL